MKTETKTFPKPLALLKQKANDYLLFAKFRLSVLVVFSAAMGYFIAPESFYINDFLLLLLGGFLVTASSNGFNQIIEREYDNKMSRTSNRPLPALRMSVAEAYLLASVWGIAGIAVLWHFLHPLCGILGSLALFLYVFIYTPLKRVSAIAVFAGAFPGSIPPMIGWVAATSSFGMEPGILFGIQFAWQFPHFWSLAWRLHTDYVNGGFRLLPSSKGKNKTSAWIIFAFTLLTIPAGIAPYIAGMGGTLTLVAGITGAITLLVPAFMLAKTLHEKWATRLMYLSFIYLPFFLLIMYLDKP